MKETVEAFLGEFLKESPEKFPEESLKEFLKKLPQNIPEKQILEESLRESLKKFTDNFAKDFLEKKKKNSLCMAEGIAGRVPEGAGGNLDKCDDEILHFLVMLLNASLDLKEI